MQGVGGGSSSSGHAISKGFRDGGSMGITNIEEIPGAEAEDGEKVVEVKGERGKVMEVSSHGNGIGKKEGRGG